MKSLEDPQKFAERHEGASQIQADIESVCDRLTIVRTVLQRLQRLIEVRDCLSIGGSRDCLATGLPAIANRLRPALAPLCMMSQSLDVLRSALAIQRRDGIDNTTVQD